LAAESAARSAPALDRNVGIWLPFVAAYEAGLWLFWVLEREVIAVPRPSLRIEADRLHCADGPAVSWPNGARYWFWRGVQVPQRAVEQPEALTASEVLQQPNAEVRRVMIERLGADRLMAMAGGEVLHQDHDSLGHPRRLLRLTLPDDEAIVMVEVQNSTPEPDGTLKPYLLRVPPAMRTCADAVAWTFGMEAAAWSPAVET